jgi:hypothetical protein
VSNFILPVNYTIIDQNTRRMVRLQYIEEQKGLCWYCKKELEKNPSSKIMSSWINKRLFPVNFFKYPVHLHHDHETGMTIGAVHSKCNAYLWQYLGE